MAFPGWPKNLEGFPSFEPGTGCADRALLSEQPPWGLAGGIELCSSACSPGGTSAFPAREVCRAVEQCSQAAASKNGRYQGGAQGAH